MRPVACFKDDQARPVFIVINDTWYVFVQGEQVFLYVNAAGVILLPTELVSHFVSF
jgi:hypothetical protein